LKHVSQFDFEALKSFRAEEFYETIKRDAEEILEGNIKFNNDWDMEQCKRPFSLIKGKAYFSPNNDGEWVYQYSRMEFLRKLVISYAKTKDVRYRDKYLDILLEFYKNNNSKKNALKPPPKTFFGKVFNRLKWLYNKNIKKEREKFPTYRTLDTVIRSYSVLIDIQYMCDEIGDRDKSFILKRIEQDVDFAQKNLRAFDETSNWGIIILSLTATCYLILEKFNDLSAVEQHLSEMLNVQIKKDGGHIENACMYHTQIMLCLLRYIHWANIKNYKVNQNIIEKCNLMVNYSLLLSDFSGFQIQYGDSDKTSLNTVFYIAKKVLKNEKINPKGEVNDIILLSEFPHFLYEKENVEKNIGCTHKNCMVDDGIWIFENELWSLRVFNEFSNSAHKHADNCSIVLYYKGVPIFVDGGRYSYFDSEKRTFYRSPLAHNVITVDSGKEWLAKNKNAFYELPKIVENKIDGTKDKGVYKFKNQFLMIERTICIIDKIGVLFINKANQNGNHTIETIWNIPSTIDVVDLKESIRLKNELFFSHTGDAIKIEPAKISYHYNEESESQRIIVSSKFENEGIQIVLLADNQFKVLLKDEKIIIKDDKRNELEILNFQNLL